MAQAWRSQNSSSGLFDYEKRFVLSEGLRRRPCQAVHFFSSFATTSGRLMP